MATTNVVMATTDVVMAGSDTPRWIDLQKMTMRNSPAAHEAFEAGTDVLEAVHGAKVLVIGAGGLGCELLKDLAMTGFKDIHVVDMDTIEVTNLNRQFLFRMADVGKSKAEVAARFINERVQGCNVTPHFGMIQDLDNEFYKQFTLVIGGLDSLEARRWLNAHLHDMLGYDSDGDLDPTTIKPFIDGGTEGLKGQARVVLPGMTACFECTLDMFPPQINFAICTIAETPRLPEHCIEFVLVLQWPKEKPDDKVDGDNPEHIQWIFERASSRAAEYGIKGVTYMLTQGVVKHIIPAVASTNAVIAASCVNEAFKIATLVAPHLSNYMMYNGTTSVYTYTFEAEKKPSCPVCGNAPINYAAQKDWTLTELMEHMKTSELQLKKPSFCTEAETIYMQAPPMLEKATHANLEKKLCDLFKSGDRVDVSDPLLPGATATLILSWD